MTIETFQARFYTSIEEIFDRMPWFPFKRIIKKKAHDSFNEILQEVYERFTFDNKYNHLLPSKKTTKTVSDCNLSIVSTDTISILARKYGWKLEQWQEKNKLLIFTKLRESDKSEMQINVYYTTGTIGTSLKHPKHPQGSQLFRKDVSIGMLESLFKNPRQHTGKGYFTK